jgi:hypothetical protein
MFDHYESTATVKEPSGCVLWVIPDSDSGGKRTAA